MPPVEILYAKALSLEAEAADLQARVAWFQRRGGAFKNILDRKLRGHEEEPFSFSGRSDARVAELADAVDSKSTDESLVGSTPTPGTTSLIADELAVLSDSCPKSRSVTPLTPKP